jgi:hypothetical protein
VQFAKSFADDHERDDAFKNIVPVLARAGRFTDALDSAGPIENRYLQSGAIGDIAIEEGRAGRVDDALQRVRAIEDPRSRALVMRRVAWDLRADAVARGEDGKTVALLADVQAIEGPPKFMFMSGIHHPSEFMPALAIIAQEGD